MLMIVPPAELIREVDAMQSRYGTGRSIVSYIHARADAGTPTPPTFPPAGKADDEDDDEEPDNRGYARRSAAEVVRQHRAEVAARVEKNLRTLAARKAAK
jgi:hypothetical protein